MSIKINTMNYVGVITHAPILQFVASLLDRLI